MIDKQRITVPLPIDLIEGMDRLERNRSHFITGAVERELARRHHDVLLRALTCPHPQTMELAEMGISDWGAYLPADETLVDPAAGTPVRWIEGTGWVVESD